MSRVAALALAGVAGILVAFAAACAGGASGDSSVTSAAATSAKAPGKAPSTTTTTTRDHGGAGLRRIKPKIRNWRIPYPAKRKREMRAYAKRHYGIDTFKLRHPHVIVEHYTETGTARAARNAFVRDVPDPEFHELPATCAHYLIDAKGKIFNLVPTGLMCRHTVGLNWTAVGIEHVGFSDSDVVGRERELRSSLALTRWLRCRLRVKVKNVIGHNESLSSPYHRERVARFRHQTHGDMRHSTMVRYRRMLAKKSCPAD
jgi:N-acetylmuramoyl-L-alanine amidase